MSAKIKIIGGKATSQIHKIPLDSKFPIHFQPEFESLPDATEIGKIITTELKLRVFHPNREEPLKEIPATRLGNDAFFEFINIWEENDKVADYDLLLLRIERITPGGALASPLSEFVIQVTPKDSNSAKNVNNAISIAENAIPADPDFNIALAPANQPPSSEKVFWKKLRESQQAMSFSNYETFLHNVCASTDIPQKYKEKSKDIASRRFLPFTDTDSYRTIKVLTEVFLLVNSSVNVEGLNGYSEDFKDGGKTIPFLKVIRDRLNDLPIKLNSIGDVLTLLGTKNTDRSDPDPNCYGVLRTSLTSPCFLELIWSYWHEESMLVQGLNAISMRFQNMRAPGRVKDPLASMEIAPLRPLNNLLWGYIQDEQHRLSVKRRNYEYDHHYGITLQGKAVPPIETADSRKNFLEAFHVLLHRCSLFCLQDDDLTVKADGFPILNNLREVHFILTEGMHNQYGDLPFTARVEMLTQQWLLARAEFREFLPSRTMVAYPESWMGPLAALNNLQGWANTSPINFNTLAIYGELLLLSIRFGNWSDLNQKASDAANWAREFRPEIQGYIHAYQATTGVDLSAKQVNIGKVDAQQPSLHLLNRSKMGSNGNGQAVASEF